MNGMWGRVAAYGAALAVGAFALQWLDYQHLARAYSTQFVVALVAAGFLGLGVFVGLRLFRPAADAAASAPAGEGGGAAQREALGISPREYEVLLALAAGLSNKEIARKLDVSPNTVKTHVSRLFEKLGARRRTDAIMRARTHGLL
ncbi:MAG: response regulator transcription factor [Caulobacterales bacterium]|jgi:DNA-binding NarL/FixJ family response regulator